MKNSIVVSKRWLVASLLVLILCLTTVGTAQAVVIDPDGTLPAGEVVDDDLILTGSAVIVDGTVNGTLIAAGQTITINGNIKSDAILAGQTIVIAENAVIEGNLLVGGADVVLRGKVLGSLFGGASTLTLAEKSSIGRNIYFGGYQFETKSGSKVVKDINVAGYQHVLSGDSRNLNLAGVAVELNGVVNGSAVLYLGESDSSMPMTRPMFNGMKFPPTLPAGLRINESAKITGKLTYTSSVDQSPNFKVTPRDGISYKTPVPFERDRNPMPGTSWRPIFSFGVGFWLWDMLRNLATLLILGALGFWLLPGLFQRGLDQLKIHPIGSIGIGFLALVLSFIAIPVVILVIVLVGLLFGATTLFDLSGISLAVGFAGLGLACVIFYTLLFWVGKLLISFTIGQWIFSKLLPNTTGRVWQFVTGAVIFALLAAIPIVGFLFSFVVALAGLGALWYVGRNRVAA